MSRGEVIRAGDGTDVGADGMTAAADCGAKGRRRALHPGHAMQRTGAAYSSNLQHMGIDDCGAHVAMAKQLQHGTDVHAGCAWKCPSSVRKNAEVRSRIHWRLHPRQR